jgi:hypothetical protein
MPAGVALGDEGEQAALAALLHILDKSDALLALRYTAFVAVTLLVYDYILTLPDEITYFWRGRKSWPALLFFINRYLPLLSMVINATGMSASLSQGPSSLTQ